ncbi:hypothetical protein K3495_g3759 [Podosphaera aphanis]|nr:hypothetical protein K3495_g3759 [Podosphaera aphanis]
MIADQINSLLDKTYLEDPEVQGIMRTLLGAGPHRSKAIDLSRCHVKENGLYYDDLIFIPNNLELELLLIRYCHDHPNCGHHGRNKVFEMISRDYWWPGMLKTITQYTNNCHTCKRINPSRLKYQSLLKQLPVPERRWRDLSVDSIGPLPVSDGLDCIMVVCCRLSKARHFIPCKKSIDAAGTANLFYKYIWKHYGFRQGYAIFGKVMASNLRTNGCPGLALDGVAPRDGWANGAPKCDARMLPQSLLQLSARQLESVTAKVTPFFANSAQHPRSAISPSRDLKEFGGSDYAKIQQNLTGAFVNQMKGLNDFLSKNVKTS